MKKFLAVVLLCLPMSGQTVYSGAGYLSGSSASGTSVCGPPNYSCFSTSTAAVALPNPIPSWGPNTCDSASPYTMQNCGNLTGAGTVIAPSDFQQAIARCTDVNSVPPVGATKYWETVDNGEPNIFASDDSSLVLKTNGGTHYIFAFNPATMACTYTGISYANQAVIYDYSSPTIIYVFGAGPAGTQIYQDTLPSNLGSCAPNCVQPSGANHVLIYDFLNSSCLQNAYNGYTGVWTASYWSGMFAGSLDNTTFSIGFASPTDSGQAGSFIANWKKSYGVSGGCDVLNTRLANVWKHDGSCTVGSPCPTDLPDTWTIHEAFTTKGGDYAVTSFASQLNGTSEPSGFWFWQTGTQHVVHCGASPVPPGYYCAGHSGEGYLNEVVSGTSVLHSFADPSKTAGQASLVGLNPILPCDNTHYSWNYDNTTDTHPILVKGQDVGAAVNLLAGAPPPCAYYDEIWLMRTDGSGQIPRAAHTFSSGWSWVFEPQNAMAVQSSSGKFAVWTTDGWGQFGSTSGGASCHVGGPDWAKNDSADFTSPGGSGYGSFIMPQSNNPGHYVFQVQSCTGYPGTPCMTGATEPAWNSYQTPGVTVTDNTITWVNTGNAADCRSEDFIVKLTR